MKKIDMKIVKGYAPAYFHAIKEHVAILGFARSFTNNYTNMNAQMISAIEHSGISPADIMGEYSDDMLNYEGFRMMSILYAASCIIMDKSIISIYDFKGITTSIAESMPENFTHNDMLQFISRQFEIDAEIIPSNVKISMAKETEERAAEDVCVKRVNLLRMPEPSETYDAYKAYIEDAASNIITSLNNDGYMHSYPVDVFATMIMNFKLGVGIGKLYRIDGKTPLPKEVLNALSKKMFQMRGNLPGIIDDFSGLDGD